MTCQGGSDYGRDIARDLGDEPPASFRDTAPDVLAPIDVSSPVSGHVAAAGDRRRPSIAESPEHDWAAAEPIIFPLLRPTGTQGMVVAEIDAVGPRRGRMRSHSQPLVDEGPCEPGGRLRDPGGGFDVIVNGDHLLSWGVNVADIQDAAMRNLAAWSATAAWTDEVSGERRLISSDTGDGWDAVADPPARGASRSSSPSWAAPGRVLVGLPGAAPADRRRPAARRRRVRGAVRRVRPRELGRRRTSRSIGGCSSSSTASSSSSAASPTPA